jgi:hypothetical protein
MIYQDLEVLPIMMAKVWAHYLVGGQGVKIKGYLIINS